MVNEWVVLELSPRGEGEDPDALRASLLHSLRSQVDIFIPASVSQVGQDKVVHHLIQGYVFVRRTLPDTAFFRLEGTRYVQSVLTEQAMGRPVRKISCVPQKKIDQMRSQIRVQTEQGIQVTDIVLITSGPYRNITAEVIEDYPELDTVQVYISLRSKQTIVSLPRSFLELVERGPGIPQDPTERARHMQAWLTKMKPAVQWDGRRVAALKAQYTRWLDVTRFTKENDTLQGLLRGNARLSTKPILDMYSKWGYISYLAAKNRSLYNFTRYLEVAGHPAIGPMAHKYRAFRFLDNKVTRLAKIINDVDIMQARLDRKPATYNILIDGQNLAYRMMHAYASTALKNDHGEGTETIYGFIKEVTALKKRFTGAHIIVCWDGSDQRRKTVFPEYKSGRTGSKLDPRQLDALKRLLPSLGVEQAQNPEEESDDIIACLVRKQLNGQKNIIYSNDRDFTQLVTRTDVLLVPKVGTRKEIMCDIDAVTEEYGVPPEQIVTLKSFLGDSSDSLPGVPRVPTKILTALVQAHGTVDGVYKSNLAGLTKIQYELVRKAEKQVRLNYQLMTLRDDLSFVLTPPCPDRETAKSLLTAENIKPDSLLEALFSQPAGFTKT